MMYGLQEKIYGNLRELNELLSQAKADGREPTIIVVDDHKEKYDSRPTIQLRNPDWWSDGEEIRKQNRTITE